MSATGIQSSGFNRLSTLAIVRTEKDDSVTYEAQSAGYGTKSPWLASYVDGTLARALRGLQDHYEAMQSKYCAAASYLENARKK